MNEKGLVVLEQYELDVRSARRGRGSFLVDTDQGLKLLTEYAGTEGRLEFQDRVMKELREKGLERLDFPVRNKEGGFLVKDREEVTYLLREWHEGRECDVRELSEVEEAVRALAFLHRNFRTAPEKETEKFREESLETELRRKNAELMENAFYNKENLNPEMRSQANNSNTVAVPEGVDAELLIKMLMNPEMAALLTSLAKTMKV